MKVTNNRIALFSALSMITGILICGFIKYTFLLILIPLIVLICGIILIITMKKFNIAVVLIFFAIGFSSFAILKSVTVKEISGEHSITGIVEEIKSNGNVILKELVIDGEKVNGKAEIKNKNIEWKSEQIITFNGIVDTISFNSNDDFSTYYYSQNIYFKIKIVDIRHISDGKLNFLSKIKKKIFNGIEKYLSPNDAGIIESLIFGNKLNLSEEDSKYIAESGLSHIFAVSGLHVGFFAGIITWILKKLKVKRIPSFISALIILLFYGTMTGFPPGVKRAILTWSIFSMAKIVYRKPDPLSTLAVFAIIILCLNPAELFDVGFIMSFCAVSGILLFHEPIHSLFLKVGENKVYSYLSSIVALTISANIFVLPVSFNVFHTFYPYSILGNLLILPIISVTFTFAAVVAILTSICSYCGILFYVLKYPLYVVRSISYTISTLPFGTITVGGMGIATIFYVLSVISLSKYILLKPTTKRVLSGINALSALLCICLV